MAPRQDHPWQRLWLPVQHSELQARFSGRPITIEPLAVPLSSLRDIPCLILLGSPGLGKSNEIRLAADEAVTRGEASEVIPLGRLAGIEELQYRIVNVAQ